MHNNLNMKNFKFTIGADPEFSLLMFNKKLNASKTIESAFKDKYELEKRNGMGYKISHNKKLTGEVGWDGCNATGEIRPNFSNNPEEVADNIGKLIKEMYDNMPLVDLITTNEHAPIGGHIHLTIPESATKTFSDTTIKTMVKKLDTLFIPLLMGENKKSELIRNKSGHYGRFGDHHIDKVGGDENGNHRILKIEYRTPNAEWTSHPKICKATLAYIATCWNEIMYNPKNINKLKGLLFTSESVREAMMSLYLANFDLPLKPLVAKIKEIVKTFEKYPDYQEEIDYILDTERVIKDKQKINYNAGTGWNLKEQNKLTAKIVISSETLAKKYAQNNNVENIPIKELVPYNDDLNCKEFATKLAIIMAYGKIQCKNNYMIFGLRKGIEEPIIAKNQNEYIKGENQAKTLEDIKKIKSIFSKMEEYMLYTLGINNIKKENTIMIGLPYNMRAKEEFKKFINIIYKLEKQNEIKTNKFQNIVQKIKEQLNKEPIENNIIEEDQENPIYDDNSQGVRLARQGIEQIERETENDNTEELTTEELEQRFIEMDNTSEE